MKTIKIIKIGGNIVNNKKTLDIFLKNFSEIKTPKILVHGGGKLASELSKKIGIPVKMIDGRRVTDANTLDVATMVYAGKINKNIVAQLQSNKLNAIGLSGTDANTITSIQRPSTPIDFGFVGDIIKVNTSIIELLLKNNITPVFCAITHDNNGNLLNTNADTIASEVAIALAQNYVTELYYCFEKNGVLRNVDQSDSIIEKINLKTYLKLKKEQIISDGMIPKLDNCFHALKNKVLKVNIGTIDMITNSQKKHTSLHLS